MKQIKFYMMETIIMMILVIIMMMISVAFMTLFERKIMGLFHYRKGPNKISSHGILQPFSDAMKLMTKEFFYPMKSNFNMFMITPMLMLLMIMMMWMIYPFYSNMLNFKMSSLYFLSIMSTTIYTLMMMGWSSNSTYAMIGALRSIAQSISYEVTFSITLMIMMTMINSLNFNFIKYFKYNIPMSLMMFLPMMILFISMLAEINRTPFDLSEGESELVSGFNIEYGSGKFTLIFLAEYFSLMLMMFLFNMFLFNLNLNNNYFYLNFILMLYFITWIRMTFPRIRYDKLMYLCWFYLLPMTLMTYLNMLLTIKMPLDLILNMN